MGRKNNASGRVVTGCETLAKCAARFGIPQATFNQILAAAGFSKVFDPEVQWPAQALLDTAPSQHARKGNGRGGELSGLLALRDGIALQGNTIKFRLTSEYLAELSRPAPLTSWSQTDRLLSDLPVDDAKTRNGTIVTDRVLSARGQTAQGMVSRVRIELDGFPSVPAILKKSPIYFTEDWAQLVRLLAAQERMEKGHVGNNDPVLRILSPQARTLKDVQSEVEETKGKLMESLSDPMQESYVDAAVYMLVSRLREQGISPAFPLFYGSVRTTDPHYFTTDDFLKRSKSKSLPAEVVNELVELANWRFPVQLLLIEPLEIDMFDLITKLQFFDTPQGGTDWARVESLMGQYLLAMVTAQSRLGLVHNDLHVSNLMADRTSEPIFYYRRYALSDGAELPFAYAVPTFGIVYRFIDFGRGRVRLGNDNMSEEELEDDPELAERAAEISSSETPLVIEHIYRRHVRSDSLAFDLFRFSYDYARLLGLLDLLEDAVPADFEDIPKETSQRVQQLFRDILTCRPAGQLKGGTYFERILRRECPRLNGKRNAECERQPLIVDTVANDRSPICQQSLPHAYLPYLGAYMIPKDDIPLSHREDTYSVYIPMTPEEVAEEVEFAASRQ